MRSVPILLPLKIIFFMRWPLLYQILTPLAMVMLLSTAGISLLDAYLAAGATEQHVQSQLGEVARTLLEADFPLTDRVLTQTRGLSGAEIALTDQAGHLLAASFAVPRLLPSPQTVAPLNRFSLGPVDEIAGELFFHSVVAADARGRIAPGQRLHLLYPQRILSEARWQAAFPPLVVGGCALLAVGLVAIVIAARLTRPILGLRAQLSRLAAGDFRPAPLPPRNDEVRDLVASVNALANELEAMRRAIKRTERLTLLGQLGGGLAHHLRNDVTGARMAIQLHQRHCRQIDQESLRVALRQLEITEEHLQRFLAAGQPQPLRRVACDLGQIVEMVAKLVEPACRHKKVRFEVHCPAVERAPSGVVAPAPSLWADPEQLRQLLLNLTLNAIEAAGPGGWVRVEWSTDARRSRVVVGDSGPGPPIELLDRLFESFVTSKPEGVGLGLAVARQIAEAHGGTLTYSRNDCTRFELLLPRLSSEATWRDETASVIEPEWPTVFSESPRAKTNEGKTVESAAP